MQADHVKIGFWSLLIVGAGVALLLYQHRLHTDILIEAIAGAFGGSDGSEAASGIIPPYRAPSAFTGVASPVGEVYGPFDQTPNPNYTRPITPGWRTALSAGAAETITQSGLWMQ